MGSTPTSTDTHTHTHVLCQDSMCYPEGLTANIKHTHMPTDVGAIYSVSRSPRRKAEEKLTKTDSPVSSWSSLLGVCVRCSYFCKEKGRKCVAAAGSAGDVEWCLPESSPNDGWTHKQRRRSKVPSVVTARVRPCQIALEGGD